MPLSPLVPRGEREKISGGCVKMRPKLWRMSKSQSPIVGGWVLDVGCSSVPSLGSCPGGFQHFLDRGVAREHLAQAVLEHRVHPLLAGQPKIFGRPRAADDRIVKAVIEDHEFE